MESSRVIDKTLDKLVGYHIRRSSNLFHSDLIQSLRPFDLRMITLSALAIVSDNPGLRQSQLADALDIERPNMVAIVDELESRKLVTRERTPNDRRAYALTLTANGKALLEKALVEVHAHEKRLLENIEPEDLSHLVSVMKKIRKPT